MLFFVDIPISADIPDSGICGVEFNASFNASNSVDWIDDLSDGNGKRIDIAAHPEMQKEYKIVVVPTIIIFNDKEEVKRFQADISFTVQAKLEDIQSVIDEIIMSSF